jgi:hypothetical protein
LLDQKGKEMTYVQAIPQRGGQVESFVAELKIKSSQELSRFMGGPWTASILSPEEIEELLLELDRRATSPLDWTEEGVGEIGRD